MGEPRGRWEGLFEDGSRQSQGGSGDKATLAFLGLGGGIGGKKEFMEDRQRPGWGQTIESRGFLWRNGEGAE